MIPRPTNKSMLASIEIGDRFFRFLNECGNEAVISKIPLVKKELIYKDLTVNLNSSKEDLNNYIYLIDTSTRKDGISISIYQSRPISP